MFIHTFNTTLSKSQTLTHVLPSCPALPLHRKGMMPCREGTDTTWVSNKQKQLLRNPAFSLTTSSFSLLPPSLTVVRILQARRNPSFEQSCCPRTYRILHKQSMSLQPTLPGNLYAWLLSGEGQLIAEGKVWSYYFCGWHSLALTRGASVPGHVCVFICLGLW